MAFMTNSALWKRLITLLAASGKSVDVRPPPPAANTSFDGLVLSNVAAASSGNQNYGPRVHWVAQGWKTTATAASQQVDATLELIPTQGTTAPTGLVVLSDQVNGGGYTAQYAWYVGGAIAPMFGSGATEMTIAGNSGSTGRVLRISQYSATNAGNVYVVVSPTSIITLSSVHVGWCDNAGTVLSGTADTSVKRVAASVVGAANAGSGAGWFQNTAGTVRLTAPVTNITTTFANLTDMTVTLIAGRKYVGRLVLPINEGLAADGFKLDLNGGTATMTSIEYGFSSAIGATLGTRTSTALATAITLTALTDTNDVFVEIPITMVCNAGGTFIPRQAKNADAAGGTLTLRTGGYLVLQDCTN